MKMRKTLTNCLLILAIVLAPLQAFSASFASDNADPCTMHQSGQTDLQSDACPDCTDHSCKGGDCAPDHCTSSHSQLSVTSVITALPVGNLEVRPSSFITDIVSRSYPPLLRPPV